MAFDTVSFEEDEFEEQELGDKAAPCITKALPEIDCSDKKIIFEFDVVTDRHH